MLANRWHIGHRRDTDKSGKDVIPRYIMRYSEINSMAKTGIRELNRMKAWVSVAHYKNANISI